MCVAPHEKMEKAIGAFADYIKNQVLADTIEVKANDGQLVDFDEYQLNIKITKS